MPTDQTDLAAAQAFRDARDAATPNWCNYYHRKRVFRNLCKWPQVGSGALIANFESFADAGFAIAARNTDLPERLERLVAEVERLKVELDKYKQREAARMAWAAAAFENNTGTNKVPREPIQDNQ